MNKGLIEEKHTKSMQAKYPVLEKLYKERIFEICLRDEFLKITENCDFYFGVKLNKAEVLELINAFKELVSEMKDNK